MSYARWSAESDVYVYAHVDGWWVCELCDLPGSSGHLGAGTFTAVEPEAIVGHLRTHIARGDMVPERTIPNITADLPELIAERWPLGMRAASKRGHPGPHWDG